MATNVETMWVSSPDQLNATVQTLIGQGGQVQAQTEEEVVVYLKKKMNVVVLVVGLLLCLVPGLAYLLWYSTADQNQQITVKIGSPANINTDKEHWYDQAAVDGASPGTVPPVMPAQPDAAAALDPSGTAGQIPPAAPTPPVADLPPVAPPEPPTPPAPPAV